MYISVPILNLIVDWNSLECILIISLEMAVPLLLENLEKRVKRIISIRDDFPCEFGAIIPIGDSEENCWKLM